MELHILQSAFILYKSCVHVFCMHVYWRESVLDTDSPSLYYYILLASYMIFVYLCFVVKMDI